MLVHVTVTDHGLLPYRDHLVDVLGAKGIDVLVDDDLGAGDAAYHADAVVCLFGEAGILLDDGTVLGEHPVRTALGRDTPVLAYALATGVPDAPTNHWDGYAVSRVEWLRRLLQRGEGLAPVPEASALPDVALRDLARTSGRLRQTAPDAVRALHRRIRDHPAPGYDAFSVSMHNIDELYFVHEFPLNREVPGEYRGCGPGGAGANTMVALRRLGLSTAVAGAVGDDADGVTLRRALEDDEVATSLLVTVSGVATGRAVMLRARDGGYSNVVIGGANNELEAELRRRGIRRLLDETASQARVLHFSAFADPAGRRLQESLVYEVPDKTIVSYKPGTMDTELGLDALQAIFRRCDVLFIAHLELDLLLGHMPGFAREMSVSAKLDLVFAWRERHGDVRPLVVAVMTGQDARSTDNPVHLHWGTARHEGVVGPDRPLTDIRHDVKDEAGARDAIVAGVLFGLLRSRSPIDCVNLAYVLAVSAFAEYGCRRALLRPTEVRERWRELLGGEPPRWLDPYG